MSGHDVYRDGRIHVCSRECKTCVFRPGNLMRLPAGRLRGMIEDATSQGSTIVCHSTLQGGGNAACRGFYDRFPTPALQIAVRLGMVAWQDPPSRDHP